MQKARRAKLYRMIVFAVIALGVALVVLSAFYVSSFLAILGVAIVFWGSIIFYITPVKYAPLSLIIASTMAPTENIERILSELNVTEKGRYLPPKNLKNYESSLVFIPEKPGQPLPAREETAGEKLLAENRNGVFLTPPGMALSRLFERELGLSFTSTDLAYVQQELPKLLIEDMEIAETVEIQTQNDRVVLKLTGNLLNEVCQETRKLPKTHAQVGCLLSSAIACVLAKATGKAVTIEKEEQSFDGKTTRIKYQLLGE